MTDLDVMDEHRLFPVEIYWRDHYFWPEEKGYYWKPQYHLGRMIRILERHSQIRCEASQVGQVDRWLLFDVNTTNF